MRSSDGAQTEATRTYLPLSKTLLRPGHTLPFHLYSHETAGELRRVVEMGSALPPSLLEGGEDGKARRYYVRADQRRELVKYQEEILSELLDDDSVPVQSKCELLQNQTVLISQDLFDQPTAQMISSQRSNSHSMVDFVMREPTAMRALLGLTHRDYYTYTHSVNVGLYGLWLLTEYFGDDGSHDLREIAAAFFLHDLGKSRIAPGIINKHGPLDDAEWAEMRRHPTYGYEMLAEEKNLTPEAGVITLQHHERMDGTGYPSGISGKDVHPYARVCSLVDAFDALTTRRSYKPAMPMFKALAIMKEEMNDQFDPDIFKLFVFLCQKGKGESLKG